MARTEEPRRADLVRMAPGIGTILGAGIGGYQGAKTHKRTKLHAAEDVVHAYRAAKLRGRLQRRFGSGGPVIVATPQDSRELLNRARAFMQAASKTRAARTVAGRAMHGALLGSGLGFLPGAVKDSVAELRN